jgi:hypothetical protein
MGHALLGDLQKTKAWKDVVDLIVGGGSAGMVAKAALEAAQEGLRRGVEDRGLVEAIWTLMQLPLAAKAERPIEALRAAGLQVRDQFTLPELLGAMTTSIQRAFQYNEGRSDLGEIARRAGHSAVGELMAARSETLNGITTESLLTQLGKLNTPKQFGILFKGFMGRFLKGYLGKELNKVLYQNAGVDHRFESLDRAQRFERQILEHCMDTAVIAERYGGEWFSKHAYEGQGKITREDVTRFTAYGLTKIMSEFKKEADRNGQSG